MLIETPKKNLSIEKMSIYKKTSRRGGKDKATGKEKEAPVSK